MLFGACILTTDAIADPTILDGDEQLARSTLADTDFYDDASPVIFVRDVGGNTVLVGGPEYQDTFSASTSVTEVVVTLSPTSTAITVTTTSGPTWVENTAGDWTATFPMPAAGTSITGTVSVELVGGDDDDDPNGGVVIIERDGP